MLNTTNATSLMLEWVCDWLKEESAAGSIDQLSAGRVRRLAMERVRELEPGASSASNTNRGGKTIAFESVAKS